MPAPRRFRHRGLDRPARLPRLFGALHIGSTRVSDGARLAYVAKVGTGFDHAGLKSLWESSSRSSAQRLPSTAAPTGRVAATTGWSRASSARCASAIGPTTEGSGTRPFLRLRSDKRPEDCRARGVPPAIPRRRSRGDRGPCRRPLHRERGESARERGERSPISGRSSGPPTAIRRRTWSPTTSGWRRFSFPISGTAPCPHALSRRDQGQVLLPEGRAGVRSGLGAHGARLPKDAEREIDYFVVDDVESLRYVANSAAIPLHLWASPLGLARAAGLAGAGSGPQGRSLHRRGEGGAGLHRILDDLELPSYPKTSGATGLHILHPAGARYVRRRGADVRALARRAGGQRRSRPSPRWPGFARPRRQGLHRLRPEGQGQTIVAPFSLRPLPGAPRPGRSSGAR